MLAFIRSRFIGIFVALAALPLFPAAAQQTDGTAGASAGAQKAAAPNAPEPKPLPQPLRVNYSKPTPLLPNPFARYIPRDVPAPVFTNAPKLTELVQNGRIML